MQGSRIEKKHAMLIRPPSTSMNVKNGIAKPHLIRESEEPMRRETIYMTTPPQEIDDAPIVALAHDGVALVVTEFRAHQASASAWFQICSASN